MGVVKKAPDSVRAMTVRGGTSLPDKMEPPARINSYTRHFPRWHFDALWKGFEYHIRMMRKVNIEKHSLSHTSKGVIARGRLARSINLCELDNVPPSYTAATTRGKVKICRTCHYSFQYKVMHRSGRPCPASSPQKA